jgi:glycosyltransferase involved in cell wall biosynthesis
MNELQQKTALRIGYLWQYKNVDFSKHIGPTIHKLAIINGLRNRGHRVRVVTAPQTQHQWSDDLESWQDAKGSLSQTLLFRGVESPVRRLQSLLQAPYFNFFDSVRYADACSSVLKGFDILYERYFLHNYGGLFAARRMGVPLVLELNGNTLEEYEQLGIELSKAQWAILRLLTRQIYAHADHLVAVTERLREQTIEQWQVDPAKITTIQNGTYIHPLLNRAQKMDIRARYGLGDKPLVMFVGGFQPWHGIDRLVDAFARVPARNKEARLVLVGDGPCRSAIEAQVDRLQIRDHVLFTGNVAHEDVSALLNTADIGVLSHPPSTAAMSGSPMKLFEYMAAGNAIVATALPNIEIILTHGSTGLIVPPNNLEAMADAICTLLSDDKLRTTLGQRARQEAIDSHSWDNTVAKVERLLYGLCKRPVVSNAHTEFARSI